MTLCGRAIHRSRLRAAALAICALAVMAVAAPSAPASVLSWGGRIGVEGQPGIPDNTYHLRSISCTTQHLCAAGDASGDVITTTNPDGGAAAWKFQNVDASRVLGAISCLPTLCVAVDYSGYAVITTNPTAATPTWSSPDNIDSSNALLGVSCPSTSLCVAVDNSGQVLSTTNPTDASPTWVAKSVDSGHQLRAVSCPSVSFCLATDNHGDSVSSTNPGATTPAWTVHTGVDSPTNSIDAVSCTSSSLCVAIDGTNDENILSTTSPTSDGAWKAASVGTGTFEELFGVSCASTSLCTAVDDGGRAFTSIKPTGNASDWNLDQADGRWGFYGVSCSPTAPPLCVGVDQAGNVVLGHLRLPDTLITQSTIRPSKGTASFSFKGIGVVSGFQCELKKKGTSASFSACHSPRAYSHLKAGSYTFLVRAVNSGGPDPKPAQRTFKIGKPPNTKITKTKIDSSKGTASFSFKAIGSASGFQCELKKKGAKASFSHCKSPKTYKHLAAGSYTFRVRAFNALGRDPTPARKSFKL